MTGEPLLDECFEDRKASATHTIDERYEFANANGDRKTGHIPVCLDHAGGLIDDTMETFTVPSDKQIGRLVDTFVRDDGQMLHSLEIFHEYPDIVHMIKEDVKAGRPWGVSLGKDVKVANDRFDILGKDITHIGITRNPQYANAKHGATWINLLEETPADFYSKLKEKLLDREPNIYMAPQTRQRLERQFARLTPKISVGASQSLSQSDSPSPLRPAPDATSNKALVSPPSSSTSFSKIMSAPVVADVMQGVTPTTPTTATTTPGPLAPVVVAPVAAPPTQPSVSREEADGRFNALKNRVALFMQKSRPDAGKQPILTQELKEEALTLTNEWDALMQGIKPTQWSKEAFKMVEDLVTYNDYLEKTLEEHARELLAENPEQLAIALDYLRKPLQEPRDSLQTFTLFASYGKKVKNTDEFNRQFAGARAKSMQLENENQTLKRKIEEMELQQAVTSKKPRLEDSSSSSSGLLASPPSVIPAIQQPATSSISVGASENPAKSLSYKTAPESADPRFKNLFKTSIAVNPHVQRQYENRLPGGHLANLLQ